MHSWIVVLEMLNSQPRCSSSLQTKGKNCREKSRPVFSRNSNARLVNRLITIIPYPLKFKCSSLDSNRREND